MTMVGQLEKITPVQSTLIRMSSMRLSYVPRVIR